MRTSVTAYVPSVEYADFLSATLPRIRAECDRVVVVTNPRDRSTIRVANRHGVEVHVTDAWTADGAYFNCARAVESAMDVYGRRGWIMLLSADIVVPTGLLDEALTVGRLYSARRRMMDQWPTTVPDEASWAEFPYHPKMDVGMSGYLLLWHASDPHLPRRTPWQPVNWRHVGGSDTEFISLWQPDQQTWLTRDVLHLGVDGVDWCGRVQPFADGSIPAGAADRANALASMLYRRRRLRRRGKYEHTEEKIHPSSRSLNRGLK